jgi:hypothetical protein
MTVKRRSSKRERMLTERSPEFGLVDLVIAYQESGQTDKARARQCVCYLLVEISRSQRGSERSFGAIRSGSMPILPRFMPLAFLGAEHSSLLEFAQTDGYRDAAILPQLEE